MGRVKTVTTKYSFIKPSVLSESEYNSYKQILSLEPTYSMTTKSGFWKEFSEVKWLLIVFASTLLLGLILDLEFLGIISMLCIFFLILILLMGTGSSMISYNSFTNKKNTFYEKLKKSIIDSNNYNEFTLKFRRL